MKRDIKAKKNKTNTELLLRFLQGSKLLFVLSIICSAVMTLVDMLNPQVIAKSGEYDAEEGCLSLPGERPAKRYRVITVKWQDLSMRPQKRKFEGYPAQIIQHEIDHCSGILI